MNRKPTKAQLRAQIRRLLIKSRKLYAQLSGERGPERKS